MYSCLGVCVWLSLLIVLIKPSAGSRSLVYLIFRTGERGLNPSSMTVASLTYFLLIVIFPRCSLIPVVLYLSDDDCYFFSGYFNFHRYQIHNSFSYVNSPALNSPFSVMNSATFVFFPLGIGCLTL